MSEAVNDYKDKGKEGDILENLLKTVKFEARTNYGKKGFECSGDEDASELMIDLKDRNELIRKFSYPKDLDYTPIFLIPLSSVEYPPLNAKFNKDDIAVVIQLASLKMDRFGRSGSLPNILIFSKEDADNFANYAKEDPTIPFSLLRKLNKGPFTRETSDRTQPVQPANIDPGESIKFFYEGGSIFPSKPFPAGFIPNPE